MSNSGQKVKGKKEKRKIWWDSLHALPLDSVAHDRYMTLIRVSALCMLWLQLRYIKVQDAADDSGEHVGAWTLLLPKVATEIVEDGGWWWEETKVCGLRLWHQTGRERCAIWRDMCCNHLHNSRVCGFPLCNVWLIIRNCSFCSNQSFPLHNFTVSHYNWNVKAILFGIKIKTTLKDVSFTWFNSFCSGFK